MGWFSSIFRNIGGGVGDFLKSPEGIKSIVDLVGASRNPDGIKMVTTPEEKAQFDAKMGLARYSPQRHVSSEIGFQMSKGIADMMSKMGEKYGMAMPINIDWDALPKYWRSPYEPNGKPMVNPNPAHNDPNTSNAPQPKPGAGGAPAGFSGKAQGGAGLPVPTMVDSGGIGFSPEDAARFAGNPAFAGMEGGITGRKDGLPEVKPGIGVADNWQPDGSHIDERPIFSKIWQYVQENPWTAQAGAAAVAEATGVPYFLAKRFFDAMGWGQGSIPGGRTNDLPQGPGTLPGGGR